MAFEINDMAEMESYKIKTQLMIAHPELAKDIFDEEEERFEELEQLDPDDPNASFSQETVDDMLNSLKDFGFYVSDTDG
jgi:chemotaxis regulatin CheY-phosphate phosphatase CheZ